MTFLRNFRHVVIAWSGWWEREKRAERARKEHKKAKKKTRTSRKNNKKILYWVARKDHENSISNAKESMERARKERGKSSARARKEREKSLKGERNNEHRKHTDPNTHPLDVSEMVKIWIGNRPLSRSRPGTRAWLGPVPFMDFDHFEQNTVPYLDFDHFEMNFMDFHFLQMCLAWSRPGTGACHVTSDFWLKTWNFQYVKFPKRVFDMTGAFSLFGF